MRKIFILAVFCISTISLYAQVTEESIVFYLPKVIPGTYRIADFGRFISNVKAYTMDGSELPVEKIETNGWRIDNATGLYKLTYTVDDTYDAEITENPIYKMGGTNIEDGKVFLVNTHGFFGYLDNMKQNEYNEEKDRQRNYERNKVNHEKNRKFLISLAAWSHSDWDRGGARTLKKGAVAFFKKVL